MIWETSSNMIILQLVTLFGLYLEYGRCTKSQFINMEYLHEESLNTLSGLTDGSLVTNIFFDTCIFQPVSGPVMMCIPKCMEKSECLAISMNRSFGCQFCLSNVESGTAFDDFENQNEIFVNLEKLERFIDDKWPYIISPVALNWTEARAFCYDKGFNLAIVSDRAERNLIRELTPSLLPIDDQLWIGGSDVENEGDWEWVASRVTFMNMSDNQRANYDGCCMTLQHMDGLWNGAHCNLSSSLPLCETTDLTPPYFFGPANTTWNEAKVFCKANNGHLVTIADELEQLSVIVWLNNTVPTNSNGSFWVGAYFTELTEHWYWIGEPVTSLLWANSQPNGGSQQNCLSLNRDYRNWKDLKCSDKKLALCETH